MNRSISLISIVVPVYREEKSLKVFIKNIVAIMESLFYNFEVIFIDDGSDDNTWIIIEWVVNKFKNFKGIRLSRNFGKESALSAGLQNCFGDIIITMDSDLQHPPSLIPKMIEIWKNSDFSIVEGIRSNRGKENFFYRILVWLFYSIIRRLTGYHLEGATDFKLFDKKVLEKFLQLPEKHLFFRGIIQWLGFTATNIKFGYSNRFSGQSNWSTKKLINLALIGIVNFSSIPLYFILFLGFIFLVIAFVIGSHVLWLKLTDSIISHFTTVIFLLLIIGSILMISLGIIGLYLSKIYDEVKGRPRFIIVNQIKSNNFDN